MSPIQAADWTEELKKQIRRGKHIILHGRVRDLVFYQSHYYPDIRHCLDRILAEEGYVIRLGYDLVDGVTCSGDEAQQVFAKISMPTRIGPAASGSSYRPSGGTSGSLGAPNEDANRLPSLAAPDVAVPALRRVLRNRDHHVSAVIDFADKLFADSRGHDLAERTTLAQIVRMASESARFTAGPMEGKRNVLVLVAYALSSIPEWLYRGNPLFHCVEVKTPESEERKHYLQQRWDRFYQSSDAPSTEPTESELELFADLTDGLSYWDLESLRLTSVHEGMPLSELRKLTDIFKFGQPEDHWEKLDTAKIRGAESSLRSRVIGQERAVEAVLNMLIAAKAGIQATTGGGKSGRPKGIFFFVGPTGVGKTELAKALTQLIFNDEFRFARYDMSEYSQEHSVERLTGAPPGYVGYESGGQLTNYVKANPFSLILFDEIDKAHPRLTDRFLQVLDDGRLTDGLGETVHFSQSVIVFTSNHGSTREVTRDGETYRVPAFDEATTYEELVKHYKKALSDYFRIELGRPELLGRLGENIVVFDLLRREHVRPVLDKFLSNIQRNALERRGLEIVFTQSIGDFVDEWCLREHNIGLGYRGVRNVVESEVIPALNRFVFYQNPTPGTALTVQWDDTHGIHISRSRRVDP